MATRAGARAVAKPRKPPAEKKLTVVKKDIVIKPVQYVKADYPVIPKKDVPGISMPSSRSYGEEGGSRSSELTDMHIYRTGENSMLFQFACGDYIFLNIAKFEEMIAAVKTLEITKEPASRRSNRY